MEEIARPFTLTGREIRVVRNVLATRRRCVEVLQNAQARFDYTTVTACRELLYEIEHNEDVIEAMQFYGLTWED